MFDWHSFMTLADELAARSEPAAQRSAISRAYYAVHNLARAWAKANTAIRIGDDDQSSHARLISGLRNEGPDATRLSVSLDILRVARNKADYDVDSALSQASVYVGQAHAAIRIVGVLERRTARR